jgi:uncharacterized protein YwqG
MNQSFVVDQMAKSGLQRVIPDVQKLIQESIRLRAYPANEKELLVGSSKLGGKPDLPASISWPVWKDNPMSFIAQIRLEDIAIYPPASRMPKNGMLSFFYDSLQETYGDNPDDRGGWQVFFMGGDSRNWQPAPFPPSLPDAARFSACSLTFTPELTLPTSPSQILGKIDWSSDEIKRYEDFLANFPTPVDHTTVHHRMFGHPNQLQDDMQLQSALFANGIPDIDDPRAAAQAAQKAHWNLLLQVDSDDNAKMKWATAGMIYYWIEDLALQQGQYDRTWLVLQAE